MKSSNELRASLRMIDHKSYPAYKSLAGAWQFAGYTLVIDHVQGDPFASPSSVHVEVSGQAAGFPAAYLERDCSRVALQDYLTRLLAGQFGQYNFKAKGSGKSGLLSISRPGQEVLERSACEMTGQKVTARFQIGFPAFGRTINAGELEKILFEFLPRCVENSLYYRNINQREAERAVFLAEDQEEIRNQLRERGWVAFVANGAVLPRVSGVSELPMKDSVPFSSPASMERTLTLPHRGELSGMAVEAGVTLIVGGGYHGKSTLLEAMQAGVYNHVAGDGREYVITDETAVKLRAEDGRSIRNVDISLFINDLPNHKDTVRFTTADASGSTSQAAGLVESMEAGSGLFLIDEDTSATNFMVRDEFMQQVISRDKEPITPFIERVRDLYEKAGISTIMVAGSSGAFFYIADRILQMDCYRAKDITERVKAMCKDRPVNPPMPRPFNGLCGQRVLPAYVRSASGHGGRGRGMRERDSREAAGSRHEHMKIKTFGLESFSLDKESISVRYLEQLTDTEQTAALAYLLRFCLEQTLDGKRTVSQAVRLVYDTLNKKGWEPFCSSYVPCGLARPRIQEVYACLNRFRG
ncbi:MAG: ABC-ATPase domain-containing protein [Lachnospiraceae bacterium]|nr:ABC-ATPase domain-containing protein [Lachnospiraceae bacterium]